MRFHLGTGSAVKAFFRWRKIAPRYSITSILSIPSIPSYGRGPSSLSARTERGMYGHNVHALVIYLTHASLDMAMCVWRRTRILGASKAGIMGIRTRWNN